MCRLLLPIRAIHLALRERKRKRLPPNKDYMFDTLTLLEMDLVKFVSRVQNLKLATSTSGNINPLNVKVPADVSVQGQ